MSGKIILIPKTIIYRSAQIDHADPGLFSFYLEIGGLKAEIKLRKRQREQVLIRDTQVLSKTTCLLIA